MTEQIEHIAVIGAGYMAGGIAHYGINAITAIGKNRAYIRDILGALID